MERSKRIATTFIGVALVTNCCQLTVAQTPGRFIRQPAKALANPVTAANPVTEATPTAANPVTAAPATTAPTTTPSTISPSTLVEAPAGTAEKGTIEPKPDRDSLDDLRELNFDSLEPLASFREDEPKFAQLTSSTQPSTSNVRTHTSPRSTQLQWTSRSGGSRSRSGDSSETMQPQFDPNSARFTSPLDARNASRNSPTFSTQKGLPSDSVKQQSDATNELLSRIATRVEAIESKFEKADAPAERDRTRASLVSARITNDPRFATESQVQSPVTRIESPAGWQAIGTRLSDHITKCESLLRRGAFCSAREEAATASMLLFRHIDLHDNLFRCEPAIAAANRALREAEDFLIASRSTDSESLRRLVEAHETPVLKSKKLAEMSPLTAVQHYRQYAESQLTEAAQGHPWASELLYTIGRTYQAEADSDSSRIDVLRMNALAYYTASRTTMPTNAVACNQLGYLLLQMDRNEEAREALVAAVKLKTDVAFLSNLAEASRRLADSQTFTWASQTLAAIRSRTPSTPPVPQVVEMSPEEFIAISPYAIGPKPETASNVASGVASANRSAAAPNAVPLR